MIWEKEDEKFFQVKSNFMQICALMRLKCEQKKINSWHLKLQFVELSLKSLGTHVGKCFNKSFWQSSENARNFTLKYYFWLDFTFHLTFSSLNFLNVEKKIILCHVLSVNGGWSYLILIRFFSSKITWNRRIIILPQNNPFLFKIVNFWFL